MGLDIDKKRAGIALMLLLTLLLYYFDFFREVDPFATTSFCDADGTCHEKPDQPSPRTIYSAKSKEQYDTWWQAHANLNATADAYATRRKDNQSARSRPLILLGDSITESWVGTDMGLKVPRTEGVPQVLTELLSKSPVGTKLDPLVLAIGGDQTQHLLYRLSHGQLLPAYAQDRKSIFVVLIGTNNLGSGELPGPTSQGVLAVAEYVLANTKGHLLLLKVLPRGDGGKRLQRLCPPRCSPSDGKPFTSFMPAVDKVNAAIADGLGSLGERHGPNRIGLIDCGSVFLTENDEATEVDANLMPDLLHPNRAGHRLLGDCILNYIKGLEKGR